MFVNWIKICPDLHKLQLWFSRHRQCLFLSTDKSFASDLYLIYKLSPSARVCISDTDREFVYQIQIQIGTVFEHFSAQNICHNKNVFQVIVVLLSCQLFDFNYLSLSNIFNCIKYQLCFYQKDLGKKVM
jgi:hypothetical protein